MTTGDHSVATGGVFTAGPIPLPALTHEQAIQLAHLLTSARLTLARAMDAQVSVGRLYDELGEQDKTAVYLLEWLKGKGVPE